MIAVLATVALVVAFVVLRDRAFDAERRRWERERGILLNRIQTGAPQAVESDGPEPAMFQPVPLDDDDAWYRQQNGEVS